MAGKRQHEMVMTRFTCILPVKTQYKCIYQHFACIILQDFNLNEPLIVKYQ